MVKSVKRCLRKMLGNSCLTYDEMLTSLIEVEAMNNLYGPLSQIDVEEGTRIVEQTYKDGNRQRNIKKKKGARCTSIVSHLNAF